MVNEYYKLDKEGKLKARRKYWEDYEKTPERKKIREEQKKRHEDFMKEWNKTHLEEHREKMRLYYHKNKEKMKEYQNRPEVIARRKECEEIRREKKKKRKDPNRKWWKE